MNSIIHKDLKNPYYVEWRDFLRKSEDWDIEQIEKYQLTEIKRIIKYSYNNCDGYRKLYDQAGVNPEEIKSFEDFNKFPFTQKELFRDRLEEFSVDIEGRTYITTGGSTGIPTGMYRNPSAFPKELASKAHQYHRVGWKEGDRQIVFRGLKIESNNHMVFIPEFNELRCSSYYLTEENMEVYRKKAWEYKPDWIRCYPSSGYIFAKFLKNTGRSFPKIKGLLCASENLYEFQIKLLKKIFKSRVFSHYGHYEQAALAGFCEYEDTYHVLPQYGYAELLDKEGKAITTPGEVGEIVATSFIMQATPFIRYRTRDLAVFKSFGCPSCGRPYNIWERLEGRTQDYFIKYNNNIISASSVLAAIHDDLYDDLKQFQFVQEKIGKVIFKYIPKVNCDQDAINNLKARLIDRFENEFEISMIKVEVIQLSKRGKHINFIQKLNTVSHFLS